LALVAAGHYPGQRPGDVTGLTWQASGLEQTPRALRDGQDRQTIVFCIIKLLVNGLENLPTNDEPNTYVFPETAEGRRNPGRCIRHNDS
jgi:hypothetical protein